MRNKAAQENEARRAIGRRGQESTLGVRGGRVEYLEMIPVVSLLGSSASLESRSRCRSASAESAVVEAGCARSLPGCFSDGGCRTGRRGGPRGTRKRCKRAGKGVCCRVRKRVALGQEASLPWITRTVVTRSGGRTATGLWRCRTSRPKASALPKSFDSSATPMKSSVAASATPR